jgi:DNA-binding transcriptional LysR family regulator
LEHVPRIFTALDQARDGVKSATNGFLGQLRIALSDGVTPTRLSTLLARCREEDPEVEMRLFEVPLGLQIKGLHEDLYDVGFSMAEDGGDGIFVTPAWEDELMVAVPARHPVLAFKQVPLKEVLRYPLALGDPAVCEGHARQVDRFLRKLDQEPLIAQRVATFDVMMTLVSAGLALGWRARRISLPAASRVSWPAAWRASRHAHDLSAAPRCGAVRDAGSVHRTCGLH